MPCLTGFAVIRLVGHLRHLAGPAPIESAPPRRIFEGDAEEVLHEVTSTKESRPRYNSFLHYLLADHFRLRLTSGYFMPA